MQNKKDAVENDESRVSLRCASACARMRMSMRVGARACVLVTHVVTFEAMLLMAE